ncbi:uncharacterized protein LOC118735845 [Rhagoletis pomonella]|uniref:uncharacterized protein LOC118735845 n=1 Tax=Rhagoletis pomonella TaxID=28610 RepID=UPI0017841E57|nr:uncharacterized protein LOC118735845 [Rhagoletis pomonella]
MAKLTVSLFLSVCLSLQLGAAFPYQNSLNSIDDNDVKSNELHNSKATESTAADFLKSLQPVILNTLAVLQDHSNTLIQETSKFVDDLLVELNALPEANEYVQELIPELTNLLDRMETIELHDDSPHVLREKAALLRAIAKMYVDFDRVQKGIDENADHAVLREVFAKLELAELNERVGKSVRAAVQKFTVVFERFWNSLSEAEKADHKDMSEWYERFEAKENAQEKFKSFVEFLHIIEKIVRNKN